MTAWISSTITVRTCFSRSRLRSEVSSRYSDSGVVIRMCGGVFTIPARAAGGVSPVRTAEVIAGAASPISAAIARNRRPRLRQVLVDVAAQRLERRHVDDARLVRQSAVESLAQELIERDQERRERLARPVGAAISVCLPSRIDSHPAACAAVGVPSADVNHRSTAG